MKAHVECMVRSAGFERHRCRGAVLLPEFSEGAHRSLLPDGRRGWAVPMDPAARVIHAGDITDLGRLWLRVRRRSRAGERQLPRRVRRTYSGQGFVGDAPIARTRCRGRKGPPESIDGLLPRPPRRCARCSSTSSAYLFRSGRAHRHRRSECPRVRRLHRFSEWGRQEHEAGRLSVGRERLDAPRSTGASTIALVDRAAYQHRAPHAGTAANAIP